jgi:hypothetical protein
MKLRIRGNTLRVRLTQSEVACLAKGDRVQQATVFSPTSTLLSSVEPSASAAHPIATFDGASVAVILPSDRVHRWTESDDVSIEGAQPVGSGQLLRILIEKDFECMHSRAEGEADAYPNPRRLGERSMFPVQLGEGGTPESKLESGRGNRRQ